MVALTSLRVPLSWWLAALGISVAVGCECTEDLSIRHGRFCMSNSWQTQRSATDLNPIVTVGPERVVIEYQLDGVGYQVIYDVDAVRTVSGNCPDKTEVYALERVRIVRQDLGAVPASEDVFWLAEAELRAEAYGNDSGINALHLGDSTYYLSSGTFCPGLAASDEDAGTEDAGTIEMCVPGSVSTTN
jgi:hypothetical protein